MCSCVSGRFCGHNLHRLWSNNNKANPYKYLNLFFGINYTSGYILLIK